MMNITRESIVQYPNDILLQKAEPVQTIESVRDTLLSMREFVKDPSNQCAGLALPQVGISKRGFVATVLVNGKGKGKMITEIFINPVILVKRTKYKHPKIMTEGCLSIDGVEVDVARHQHIVVTYKNLDGKVKQLELLNFSARVIQHELDHLNGILMTERATKTLQETV